MSSRKASLLQLRPDRENRLAVARALYKSLVARYPDKVVILYNDCGIMLAHSDDDNRDASDGSLLSKRG
jgi:hypothetical protein